MTGTILEDAAPGPDCAGITDPSDLPDDTYELTELGHARLQLLQARLDVGAAWKIIDEQDEKIHLLEQNNRTLQSIVSNLSARSGILVVSPAYKRTQVKI